jgi:hypothetical protein
MVKKSSKLLTLVTGLALGAAAMFLSKKENVAVVKKGVKKVAKAVKKARKSK